MGEKLRWERLKRRSKLQHQGSLDYRTVEKSAGDPLAEIERQPKGNPLNRQYRRLRLDAEAEGRSFPSYNDWMAERQAAPSEGPTV